VTLCRLALAAALRAAAADLGHALSLHLPLLVATAGYLVAVALACVALR